MIAPDMASDKRQSIAELEHAVIDAAVEWSKFFFGHEVAGMRMLSKHMAMWILRDAVDALIQLRAASKNSSEPFVPFDPELQPFDVWADSSSWDHICVVGFNLNQDRFSINEMIELYGERYLITGKRHLPDGSIRYLPAHPHKGRHSHSAEDLL